MTIMTTLKSSHKHSGVLLTHTHTHNAQHTHYFTEKTTKKQNKHMNKRTNNDSLTCQISKLESEARIIVAHDREIVDREKIN